MPDCQYPPCTAPRSGETRGIDFDLPLALCAEHIAAIDSNGAQGGGDFWRWAMPAMGTTGHG